MGAGASAVPRRDPNEGSSTNPYLFPCQHFVQGARSQKSWIDREIRFDNENIYVMQEGSSMLTSEDTPSLLTLSLLKDIHISVDRTDESRRPVLVLRQEPHVLCIMMRDIGHLDAFKMDLDERMLACENTASDSTGRGLAKMFELFEDVIEVPDSDTADAGVATKLSIGMNASTAPAPVMSIVILVVGTRGDMQPFVFLGQALQQYGHRVRLATHSEYRQDVTGAGLEFYPLAGDPKKLSSYMVKTGGRLLPDLLKEDERRELPEKMQMLRDIMYSTWPACTAEDLEDPGHRPFVADAIIANPVSCGHIHCAEALCIPLHVMFPQPWSPTKCFPHPLSNMDLTSKWSSRNWYSYKIVDEFMWLGMQFMINDFRRDVLQISPIRTGEHGDSLLNDNKVPISHMWSPAFVPKCPDWPKYVDVVGEFRNTQSTSPSRIEFSPDPAFQQFLDDAGATATGKPVYVGFGSMVIADPATLVDIIKESASNANCHVILQSGWAKYAEDNTRISDHVFVVGNMPHDYLFQHVGAVVHHGGAGTTAAGLRAGNPTFVCPFFGDQHFWAEMVHRSGAGPAGCPISKLTLARFQEALDVLRAPKTQDRARSLAALMNAEDGVSEGVNSFHRNLPVADMLCEVSIFNRESKIARVYCSDCGLKMCSQVDDVVHRASGGRESHSRVPFRCMRWGVIPPENILDGIGQGIGAVAYEVAGGLYDLVSKPFQRGREEGAKGAAKGLAEGFAALVARPIRGGGILIDRVTRGAKNKKQHHASNTSQDVILRHRISNKARSGATGSTQLSIALNSGGTDMSSLAELVNTPDDNRSEIPETIHEFEDDDDDIVLNGRTLDDLNMKRGTENGIKYFLKDVVRTHIKMANGKQASMSVYDLVSPLKKQVLRQEIDNGSEQENDSGTQNSNEGLDMKTVVETEKAFQRALQFMIVWAELDTSGDRMIGLAELEKLLPQSEASALMRSADVNKDGELTFSELAHQIMKHVEI